MTGRRVAQFRLFPRIATLACLALLSACTGAPGSHPGATGAGARGMTGSLQIFADSSLSPAMGQLAQSFVSTNPGVRLLPITYEGTQALVTEIQQGSTADVVAMADPAAIAQLGTASLLVPATVHPFALDPLQIVVKAGNPSRITALADLAKAGVTVVLPDPSIPLGAAVAHLLALGGLRLTPAATELQVPAIVQQVATGTADAGIVAASDIVSGEPEVTGVAIPAAQDVDVADTAAAMTDSPNQTVAAAFVAYLLSPPARAILTAAGFVPGAGKGPAGGP